MSIKDFMGRKPHFSFVVIAAICVGISFAVTQVQATISDNVASPENNPHHLPNEFNPRIKMIEEKIQAVKVKAIEEVGQELNTIHSLALENNKSTSKPVYDYTTGTSN